MTSMSPSPALGRTVSTESAEIIRMFSSAFDTITGNTGDYWPEPLRLEIEAINARIYKGFDNGVYRARFATTQEAYDEAATEVFATLDAMEQRLGDRRWLLGEADRRFAPTLFHFEAGYHDHF